MGTAPPSRDVRSDASPTSPGKRNRLGALGAVAAQSSQALASLVLQIAVARLLGVEGLGAFAVLYGVVIMATAVCTGFVGDSLTVLDRSRPNIRSALQVSLLVLAIAGAVVSFLVGWLGGFLTPAGAGVFAAATAVFLVQDILRRMLMADLRFWRIVVVDLATLAGALLTMVVAATAGAQMDLGMVVLALLVGQVLGTAAGVALVPSGERWLAPLGWGAFRSVLSYGSPRAAQQFIRPGMLTAVRFVVVAVAGLTAMGELEAARIYTAPLLLVVSGASSYLFASYASATPAQADGLLRRADRGVLLLFAATVAMSIVAVACIGVFGPLITDGDYALSVASVMGWCAYAVSVSAVTPYGALAAVRRRQVAVLVLRSADSLLSLAGVAVLLVLGGGAQWIPLVLAAGSLCGGVAIRQFLLTGRHRSRVNDTIQP